MRRREFITLLGGATAAWPQSERMRRIGVLANLLENDPEAGGPSHGVPKRSLQELRWVEGRSVFTGRLPGGAPC